MQKIHVRTARSDEAQVDLCPRCGCVFMEFFDGEPSELSRRLEKHLRSARWTTSLPSKTIECPACEVPMIARNYLDGGPLIVRCEHCMAVFATPSQVEDLAMYQSVGGRQKPPWLERLRAMLMGEG